jgi:hypothetical protein
MNFSLRQVVYSLIISATMMVTAEAQMHNPSSARERIKAIDSYAPTLAGTDTATVAQYTADVLQVTSLRNLNPPLRDRCRRAEQDYRTGLRPAVTEAQVVAAVNKLGYELSLPGFTPTNLRQVRAVRFLMLPTLPNLLSSPTRDEHNLFTQEMSPIGAVYLASLIIEQKAMNIGFQMAPDAWVDQLDKMSKSETKNVGPRAVAQTATTPGSSAFRRFREDLTRAC